MTNEKGTPGTGTQPQAEPARVGDKVVYCGQSAGSTWAARRANIGIVVEQAESAEYYNVIYTHAEHDTWLVKSNSIRVIERATYTPVTAESRVDGA